jgi:leucyl-tRNA synthetase
MPFDPAKVAYWGPVDFNSGGIEHAILHQIYSRFFSRVFRDVGSVTIDVPALTAAERAVRRKTHDTIRRITNDVDVRQQFNTAIAAMMELVNDLYAFTKQQESAPSAQAATVVREALETLIVMLSPFAPHTAEELWEQFGHSDGMSAASWPAFDAEAARAEEIVIPVQVNGKVRSRLTVSPETSDGDLEKLALADAAVQPYVQGKTVKKVVIAKGRLISIVV